ncbi:uncharacterized protein LOC117723043 [Arvicanthis niloticus]|uniref:uncharacterized protein LOC117723043 n=1 Tax=Arvicanthis niloticus TaxID=61156 RepID=UPI00402BDB86
MIKFCLGAGREPVSDQAQPASTPDLGLCNQARSRGAPTGYEWAAGKRHGEGHSEERQGEEPPEAEEDLGKPGSLRKPETLNLKDELIRGDRRPLSVMPALAPPKPAGSEAGRG